MNEWAKGTENWMMFNDFWKLCQLLWKVEKTDEYWDNAVEKLKEFTYKYGNKPFPRALALALSDELERRYKGGS